MIADKSLGKGISLFIKAAIFVISLYYIFYKVSDIYRVFDISYLFSNIQWRYFIYSIVLLPLNWAIEARKWQYLIRKLEVISFATAYKSVLAGVSIGIFTPNRVGEFAGKIFFLKTEDKVKATLISVWGSVLQLTVTIVAALIATLIYYYTHENLLLLTGYIDLSKVVYFMLLLTIIGSITIFLYTKSERFKDYWVVFTGRELFKGFYYSAIRYIVFSMQYYLVVRSVGINVVMPEAFTLIAFIFFVNTVIPTMAFTEIAVRTASGLFFLGSVSSNTNAIIASSLILWLINLGLPALVGLKYIWQLKILNE